MSSLDHRMIRLASALSANIEISHSNTLFLKDFLTLIVEIQP